MADIGAYLGRSTSEIGMLASVPVIDSPSGCRTLRRHAAPFLPGIPIGEGTLDRLVCPDRIGRHANQRKLERGGYLARQMSETHCRWPSGPSQSAPASMIECLMSS